MDSWDFFDYLLNNAQIVGTPGAGFGKNGQKFFRLTSFGTHNNTIEAMERIDKLFNFNRAKKVTSLLPHRALVSFADILPLDACVEKTNPFLTDPTARRGLVFLPRYKHLHIMQVLHLQL